VTTGSTKAHDGAVSSLHVQEVTAHPPPAPIEAGRARRRAGAPEIPQADDIAEAPVSLLPGAGPATTLRLSAHGLGTIGALLAAVPRAYTPLDALAQKVAGAVVLVRGRGARGNIFPRRFLTVTLEADA